MATPWLNLRALYSTTQRTWFDAMLPVAAAALLFIGLTYIMYAGTRRDRLASQVEAQAIIASLRVAMPPIVKRDEVYIISLVDSDLKNLPLAPSPILRGAHITVYSDIMERILAVQPERVFLSWLPAAHLHDRVYLDPIISVLKQRTSATEVLIPYPIDETASLPQWFKDEGLLYEGDDCDRAVQFACSYNTAWDRWVLQAIADRYWQSDRPISDTYYLSTNLPHFRPNYLIRTSRRQDFNKLTFTEFLDLSDEELQVLKGKHVFIGNSIHQKSVSGGDSVLLRRTFLPQDRLNVPLEVGGTPFHVFWAQLAQMFIDQQLVAVVPFAVSLTIAVLFSLAIVFLLVVYGAAAGLGSFLVVAMSLPVINMLGVSYFSVYVPIFDIVYFGLITFLFSLFGYLALQAYQRLRFDQLSQVHAESADLRGNFISLVSHNLNTPIAQMQGLIDMLQTSAPPAQKIALTDMAATVVKMKLLIRSVLITTAVEGGSINPKPLSVSSLCSEFESLLGSAMRRLGIDVELVISEHDKQEGSHQVPVMLDARIVAHAIAALVVLRHDGLVESDKITVTLSLEGGRDLKAVERQCLHVAVESTKVQASSLSRHLLRQGHSEHGGRQVVASDLFEQILANLAKAVVRNANGEVFIRQTNGSDVFCLILPLEGGW